MRINDTLSIDERWIEERYARASGPGGQHVNTTESAVQLRFDLSASDLPEAMKARARRLAGSRLTKDGLILIHVDAERARVRNREIARARLAALLDQASRPPKRRVKTRPSLASIKRSKDAKARRGAQKALRRKPGRED